MRTSPPSTHIVYAISYTQPTAAQIKLLITHMIYTHAVWHRALFTLHRQRPCIERDAAHIGKHQID